MAGLGLGRVGGAAALSLVAFTLAVYASLRARFGVAISLVASSVLFALPHGYSAAGLAQVLWTGATLGFAYELSRSSWPSVAVHGLKNGLSAAGELLLYR